MINKYEQRCPSPSLYRQSNPLLLSSLPLSGTPCCRQKSSVLGMFLLKKKKDLATLEKPLAYKLY
jgi:hypothetical protein